jgi:hypothetical protein
MCTEPGCGEHERRRAFRGELPRGTGGPGRPGLTGTRTSTPRHFECRGAVLRFAAPAPVDGDAVNQGELPHQPDAGYAKLGLPTCRGIRPGWGPCPDKVLSGAGMGTPGPPSWSRRVAPSRAGRPKKRTAPDAGRAGGSSFVASSSTSIVVLVEPIEVVLSRRCRVPDETGPTASRAAARCRGSRRASNRRRAHAPRRPRADYRSYVRRIVRRLFDAGHNGAARRDAGVIATGGRERDSPETTARRGEAPVPRIGADRLTLRGMAANR